MNDAPRAWLLLGDKGGDNAQLRLLAGALGLPAVERPLSFNRLYKLPNRLLGASLASLSERARGDLAPPWPDIVLSSGRRAVPVARWIRARSGGRTKLVHVGRPWAPLAWFDLVVAMPQYALPAAPNAFAATLPFNRVDMAAAQAEAARRRDRPGMPPPPYVTLLVGGPAKPIGFTEDEARRIGVRTQALADELGASVLAITSRRTPPRAVEALASTLRADRTLLHRYSAGDSENPYRAFIALADRLVVTGDSASMLAEACHSGKPVAVAPLGLRSDLKSRAARALASLPAAIRDRLHAGGWIVLPRDMAGLIARLRAAGHVSLLGEAGVALRPPPDDLAAAVARIRALLAR